MKKLIAIGIPVLLLLSFPLSTSYNEFVVSTDDGLQLTLNENGEITSIKVDGKEIGYKALPFYIRDFTPDYEIRNLIYNPSFEIDDNKDGIADGWQLYAIQGEMNITLDEDAYSGNFSLKMFSYASKKSSQMACISSPLEIKEGVEYCLSLYAKNDFGFLQDGWSTSMYAACIFYDAQGNEISQEELQIHHTLESWKKFSKIFISPLNAKEAKIAIIFTGPRENSIPGMEKNTAWFDDICFYELPEEAKMKAIEGGLKEEGNKLIYEGSFEELKFSTTYESKGKYIEVNGEIEGRKEKAIDIYFLLPIDATQWKWWDDIRNWREISDGVYQLVENADESSYLPISPYPMAAITKNVGIAIAIPLSKPRIFRIFYDSNIKKFGISFNFGISPLAKFNKVNFTIYIYKCNASRGFRSALARYYKFFPEYFEESIDSKFLNCSYELADFGIRAIQGHFHNENQAKLIAEYNEKNIYVAEYTLPTEIGVLSLQGINEPCPNYDEFISLIDYYAKNGSYFTKMKAMAAKNSTMLDINGNIILGKILRGPNWAPDAWVARIPLNTEPDLQNGIAKMMIQIIQLAFENAEKYGGIIDGVEIDNFMKMCRYIDTNSSRFQYVDYLVYNPNDFKPGIHGMVPMVEYLKNLSEWAGENYPHVKITGNCVEMGIATFGFPYLAALPFEMGSLTRWNFDDKALNYRRSMAYHRYVAAHQCNKMYDEYGRVILPYVYEFVNESLFYGIYPLMKDDFFANCNYEKARPIYKKIIPILDELYLAGWEPITYAYATNDIWVERFGNGSIVYFTVRNNDSVAKEYEIVIEANKLGIEEGIYIIDMLSGKNVSFEYGDGTLTVHDRINAKETKVFKVSKMPFLSVEIIKPREGWLYVFNKPVMPARNTIIIGKITVETSVYGSEGISKVEFYVDNRLKFTDEDEPYKWTWSEFSFGKHGVKVIVYDSKENVASDEINVFIINF